MKKIPKTARGRANRVRDTFQSKPGVVSIGLTKNKTGEHIWQHQVRSKASEKAIDEATKKMGGKVFRGGKMGDGFQEFYAVFK